ncbi:MAG TPA: hypothetical protein VGI10_10090 [Polyangiaceae bacterium]|jgi:hypothetical protein
MKTALIRWLLRRLGYEPPPPKPFTYFYALVENGERVADVTTNRWRARAIALEQQAQGKSITLWQCAPVKKILLRETA